MSAIADVHGRQILDSRGNPTVEVDVRLESGALGRAAVPSGASTGVHEAVELRDGGAAYGGKGVTEAVANVNGEIAAAVRGLDAADQAALDRRSDRARRHRRTRAGSARTRSSASRSPSRRRPRPRPASRSSATSAARRRATLPVPMMNVINGGVHAENSIDLQEFMVVPAGAATFAEALRIGAEVYHALKARPARARARDRGRRRGRLRARPRLERGGDRGDPRGRRAGGPPRARRDRARPGGERGLRATALYRFEGREARRRRHGRLLRRTSSTATRSSRSRTALAEDDWDGWRDADRAARRPRPARRRRPLRHERRAARSAGSTRASRNSILIKVNQIGTLTETLDAIGARAVGRLHGRDLAPLRRDRGHDDRRPRGRDQRRPDQDRRARALRPRRQVQPAAPDRGGARRARRVSRAGTRSRGVRPLAPRRRYSATVAAAAIPRRTKIVATIGPASATPEMLARARRGRDGRRAPQLLARRRTTSTARGPRSSATSQARAGRPLALIADLQGPKLRHRRPRRAAPARRAARRS